MSGESYSKRTSKTRRVNKIKRLFMFTMVVIIFLPIVLCVMLFMRVILLEQSIIQMSEQLDTIQSALEEQKLSLSQESGELQTVLGQSIEVLGTEDIGVLGAEVSGGDVQSAKESEHKVYLTFDDGPSIYTEEILEILDRYDVKATFFVLGKEAESSQESIREIVNRGHTLGMHSYSHKYNEIYNSVEAFSEDFLKMQDYLFELTGIRCTVYRFPGGSSNKVSKVEMNEFADYLETQDTRFFDWNIESGDAANKRLSVSKIVENSIIGIAQRSSSMILMHDTADKRTTVEALPMIIENILAIENTVILPITDDTRPIQHIQKNERMNGG